MHKEDGVYTAEPPLFIWSKNEKLTAVREATMKAALAGILSTAGETAEEEAALKNNPRLWTVECGDLQFKADTLEEAMKKAIEAANNSGDWNSADESGATFVHCYVKGYCASDSEFYDKAIYKVPFPYSEQGVCHGRPTVTIEISGGVVQEVKCDGAAVVTIVDHDNSEDGNDPFNSETVYTFPEESNA